MSPSSSKLVRLFLAGLLAAFPLIATALLIAFVVGIVIRWLGPSSAVGSVMAKMGLVLQVSSGLVMSLAWRS